MRHHLVLLVALGLGLSVAGGPSVPAAPLELSVINAGLDPKNPKIVKLVAHFQANGIRLEHDGVSAWRVTQPAIPKFNVNISLRAFPDSASAEQMQDSFALMSLGYLLNAKAHVAMSYPWLSGGSMDTKDPRFVALQAELKRVFDKF